MENKNKIKSLLYIMATVIITSLLISCDSNQKNPYINTCKKTKTGVSINGDFIYIVEYDVCEYLLL